MLKFISYIVSILLISNLTLADSSPSSDLTYRKASPLMATGAKQVVPMILVARSEIVDYLAALESWNKIISKDSSTLPKNSKSYQESRNSYLAILNEKKITVTMSLSDIETELEKLKESLEPFNKKFCYTMANTYEELSKNNKDCARIRPFLESIALLTREARLIQDAIKKINQNIVEEIDYISDEFIRKGIKLTPGVEESLEVFNRQISKSQKFDKDYPGMLTYDFGDSDGHYSAVYKFEAQQKLR